VRTHNVEHEYYESLAKIESTIFKRYYFYNEAGKLKKYESVLHHASGIAAISPNDTNHFSKHYKHVHYIPAFHPNDSISAKEGKGDYAFYHGNLAIAENNEAALFLVRKVFNDLPYQLVIAGSKPSDELTSEVKGKKNIILMNNLNPIEIHEYIRNAHCNVLPTFQATGIKLKLLSALFAGRFCIVNTQMVENTGLENLCIISDSDDAMKEKIKNTFEQNFNAMEIEKREKVLMSIFSNDKNALLLMNILF
jgi:glycosyltransferase involved in cell wall biosynthesis